jgi:hypothetical protein
MRISTCPCSSELALSLPKGLLFRPEAFPQPRHKPPPEQENFYRARV